RAACWDGDAAGRSASSGTLHAAPESALLLQREGNHERVAHRLFRLEVDRRDLLFGMRIGPDDSEEADVAIAAFLRGIGASPGHLGPFHALVVAVRPVPPVAQVFPVDDRDPL